MLSQSISTVNKLGPFLYPFSMSQKMTCGILKWRKQQLKKSLPGEYGLITGQLQTLS